MKNKVGIIFGNLVLAFIVWLYITINYNQRPERIMVDIVDTMAPASWEILEELEEKEASYEALRAVYDEELSRRISVEEENEKLSKANVQLSKERALFERLLFDEIDYSDMKDSLFQLREHDLKKKVVYLHFDNDSLVRELRLSESGRNQLFDELNSLKMKHYGNIMSLDEVKRNPKKKDFIITFEDEVRVVERKSFLKKLFERKK